MPEGSFHPPLPTNVAKKTVAGKRLKCVGIFSDIVITIIIFLILTVTTF